MSNIDYIIRQVLTGNANENEAYQFNQWLEKSDENKQVFEIIKNSWNRRTKEPTLINEEEIFEKVWQEGTGHRGLNKPYFSNIVKFAASFVVIALFSYFLLSHNDSPEESNSKTVSSLITKENPAGQKSKLFLPDGSINAESSVQYMDDFTDSIRLVYLSGEAFFEVAKDSLRPFIVQTENVFTEAIGTVFNINSYAENENININLISGKVKIHTDDSDDGILLDPGEAICFNRINHRTKKQIFNLLNVTGWKDGILIFDDASFQQVVHSLKRWYGININIVGDPVSEWEFSGRFDNEYLINVLEVMQYNRDFEFNLKNKELTIIFN